MPSRLILRHDNWDGLIAELASHPERAYFARIARETAQALLAAPAALAWWIAHRAPRLAAGRRLRVLVIGAETVDAADQGRWYALLPELLGGALAVEATLVGDALDVTFASSAARFAPEPAARCARTSLSAFLGERGVANLDLAVVFHPGLQKNRGWLEDGSLARLIAAGVPLVASSYGTDEFEMDRWVLECYGFGVAGDALLNPLFLELGEAHAQVRWGRALWRFAGHAPRRVAPDRGRLDGLDLLTRMVMHSMNTVGAPTINPGARVELQAAESRLSLIHVFDNHLVDPSSRKLWRLTADGGLQPFGELSAADLAAYPAHAARDIERAMWAARIKAERLLPHYPGAAAMADADRAASMLSAMRERAASLFRK